MATRYPIPEVAAIAFTRHEEGGLKAKGVLGDPNRAWCGVNQTTYDRYRDGWGLPHRDVALAAPEEVGRIYGDYWRRARCDAVARQSGALAICYFDTFFNGGGAEVLGMTEGEAHPDNLLTEDELEALPQVVAAGEDAAVTAFLQNRLTRFQRLHNWLEAQAVWEGRLNRLAAYVGVSWRVPEAAAA